MSYILISLMALTWPLGNLIRWEIFRNVFITPLDVAVLLITLRYFRLSSVDRRLFMLFAVFLLSLLINYQRVTLFSVAYFARFFLYLSLFWSLGVCSKKILTFWSLAATAIGLILFVLFPDTRIMLYAGWDEHYYRLIGPWLDPNFTGGILVLAILFLFSIKNWVSALFIMCLLLLTFSRSSYLSLLAGLFVFFDFTKWKKTILLFVLFVLLFVLFVVLFPNTAEGQNLFRTASIQGRLDSYQQGLFIFLQNPVLGIGFNNYPRFGGHVAAPDSSLLFVLATTGVVGFSVFLYSLITLYRRSSLIFRISFISLILHSLFVNSLFYPPILVWFSVLYNIENANNRRSSPS